MSPLVRGYRPFSFDRLDELIAARYFVIQASNPKGAGSIPGSDQPASLAMETISYKW